MAQLSNCRCTNLSPISLSFIVKKAIRSLKFVRLILSFFLQISDDGRYVVLSITEGCEPVNQLWYCDLQQLPDGITGLYELDFIYVTETIVEAYCSVFLG